MPIIVVGNSAVELHTDGEITSGDIDLCETDEALETALLEVGFSREDRRGKLLRGFYMMTPHGEIGVEPVSGPLFDNHVDRQRLRLFSVEETGVAVLAMPPMEDMIADRLAQYEANPSGHVDMLEQARIMLDLAEQLDSEYLNRRVRDECVDVDFVLRALQTAGSSEETGTSVE